jgi:hypothetical protein
MFAMSIDSTLVLKRASPGTASPTQPGFEIAAMAAHVRNVGEVASSSSESSTVSVRSASEARDGGKSTGEIGLLPWRCHFEVVALSDASMCDHKLPRRGGFSAPESNRPYSQSRSGQATKDTEFAAMLGTGPIKIPRAIAVARGDASGICTG